MATVKTIITLFTAIFMFVYNGITSYLPGFIPSAKSEEELADVLYDFDIKPLADEIVVVNGLSKDERAAIQCLQGLVGRTQASIFINYGYQASAELADLEKAGSTLLYKDENGSNWDLTSLINRYAEHITDNGYVLFSDADTHAQINLAFNYATVNGWLAVPVSAEAKAIAAGLEKKLDLSTTVLDFTHEQAFYEEHRDFFRKDCLVHLYAMASGLRDLAVQQKIFITYVEDSDYVARAYRDMLYSELEPASMILGWCKYEIKHTECAGRFGHYVIPSDHSFNTSVLTCNRVETGRIGNENVTAPELDPTKHYVAIVWSDGDNAQWISNGYSEFHTWQSYDIDIPVTWTFAPQMYKFSSTAVKKALENKDPEDSFITGPSGAGYGRISMMSPSEVRAYSDITAAAMLKSGISTITLLDEIKTEIDFASYAAKLGYFARYDNITGGILQVDPDDYTGGYGGGRGRVFFSNDKPFVSVGFSLWHPSGDAAQVNQEWLKAQADIINSYPADINTINGYTVINVHPWTVGPDDLAYFVSQLDDGVEFLSADELLAAVAQNIPHKNATKTFAE
ncbi:MAG: hypothetical protein IKL41_02790 [Clostridia bacterium]|nr:hypothetical protein [Clostridia bacterium]